MQTIRSAAAASVGARVLGEIEETTLDEVLASLRAGFQTASDNANDSNSGTLHSPNTRLPTFPIGPLNDLVHRHFRATQSAPLALTGRYRELLYVLVATLIAAPHEKAVAIVDFEGRFDPLRLLATTPAEKTAPTASMPTESRTVQRTDLDHVHILRPARNGGSPTHIIADCVASIEGYMLYGTHRSRGREWWGTVVIGGGLNPAGSASAAAAAAAAAQVAVTADWRGWLRVDRAEVPAFWDVSAEEALADRGKRQKAVEDAGWVASSPWGGFSIGRREMGR